MDQISMLFEKFNITIHSSNSFLIELLAHNIKVVGLPSIIALSIISSDFGWSVFFPLLIWKRWLELLKRWRSFSKKICWAMMQASKLAIFHRIDWDSSIDEVFSWMEDWTFMQPGINGLTHVAYERHCFLFINLTSVKLPLELDMRRNMRRYVMRRNVS